jgi:hypothetical protein
MRQFVLAFCVRTQDSALLHCAFKHRRDVLRIEQVEHAFGLTLLRDGEEGHASFGHEAQRQRQIIDGD